MLQVARDARLSGRTDIAAMILRGIDDLADHVRCSFRPKYGKIVDDTEWRPDQQHAWWRDDRHHFEMRIRSYSNRMPYSRYSVADLDGI